MCPMIIFEEFIDNHVVCDSRSHENCKFYGLFELKKIVYLSFDSETLCFVQLPTQHDSY